MRARIDISEVETKTKIRAKYLRAIENEEWDLLPGPVYVKSFLKTYGDYLGLDSRLLVDEFKRRYERPSDPHEIRPMATISRERERAARGPLLPSWAIVALVLAAIVLVFFVIGSATGGNGKSPTPVAATSKKKKHHHRHGHHAVHHAAVKPAAPTSVTLSLVPTGAVWVAWPKKASGVPTDMTEHVVRDVVLPTGWVDTKVCAIDATWSCLRFVVRLADRPH